MRALRDIAIVAGHELSEAMRSRRVVVLAVLYVGGAVSGTAVFVDTLSGIEAELADALAASAPDKPGAVTQELMRTPEFTRILTRLVRDRELALRIASLPPLALFYGWLALTFSPVLVMLTTSETIASELSSGAIRFSLLRTERLSYSIGKLVGQSLLMMASIVAGAVGVWITGYFSFDAFAPGATALWLWHLCGRASCYGFAYVGIALGLSHMTRSVPISRALGLVALGLLSGLWGLRNRSFVRDDAFWDAVLGGIAPLLPRAHMLELWRPELADRGPALLMLVALGIAYFAAGYRYRARRDA